ncbi:hypothetical protein [Streptomyces sp. NPDC048057]|uniref:hypothetical protein n=1 Tax=Streptomyces sp. NPDC048057 TaxID=3155628 RepID=UPI003407004D
MSDRISALISAFGVLPGTLLFVGSLTQYRSGASPLWVVAGSAILLLAVYALVRDVRRLRGRTS